MMYRVLVIEESILWQGALLLTAQRVSDRASECAIHLRLPEAEG